LIRSRAQSDPYRPSIALVIASVIRVRAIAFESGLVFTGGFPNRERGFLAPAPIILMRVILF
jgi:hypothetical protein